MLIRGGGAKSVGLVEYDPEPFSRPGEVAKSTEAINQLASNQNVKRPWRKESTYGNDGGQAKVHTRGELLVIPAKPPSGRPCR